MDTSRQHELQVWAVTPEQAKQAAMHHFLSEISRYRALISLILANLIPLFGAAFFGWSLLSILLLYWLESAIVGFYNVLKLAAVSGHRLIPFFIVHYGVFMAGHLIFILAFFGPKQPPSSFLPMDLFANSFKEVATAFFSIFVSHGISFFHNFIGNREFENTDSDELMRAPYNRIFIMHLTVIGGGWLSVLTRPSIYGLVIMILLKIASDIHAHLKEHSSWEEEAEGEEVEEGDGEE